MKLKRPIKKTGDENVIPLINVVFLMLIFFLIAGTLKSFSNKDITPTSVIDQSRDVSPKKIQLYISSTGTLYLNEEVLEKEQLPGYLNENMSKIREQDKFNILIDKELDSLVLVDIMETISKAGISNSHIIAIKRRGQ